MTTTTFAIPHLIHLIWIGSLVPQSVTNLIERCQELNPAFDVVLWRDHDLAGLRNRRHLECEPRLSGKANIARYEILHDHGGVYLDCDFLAFRPLAEVTKLGASTGFVAARESRSVFNNAFLAASPGHPLTAQLLSGLDESIRDFRHAGSPVRTGPLYLTESIVNFVSQGGSLCELPQAWVFPYYFDRAPCSSLPVSPETILNHEWAAMGDSWSRGTQPYAPTRRDRVRRQTEVLVGRARPTNLRAELSRRPLAHRLQAKGYDTLSWMASLGIGARQRRQGVQQLPAPELSGSRTDELPSSVRWTLTRAIMKQIRGSATYVDVGLPDDYFWRLASTRLDRAGRAVRVGWTDKESCDQATALKVVRSLQAGTDCRGSRALALATDQDLSGGEWLLSSGGPMAPRILDASRSFTGWNIDAVHWTLPWLLDSVPCIDLLVVGPRWKAPSITATIERLAREGRIRMLICVVDSLDVANGTNATRRFLNTIEGLVGPGKGHVKDSSRNQGWSHMVRTAQGTGAVVFDLGECGRDS